MTETSVVSQFEFRLSATTGPSSPPNNGPSVQAKRSFRKGCRLMEAKRLAIVEEQARASEKVQEETLAAAETEGRLAN